MTVIRAYVVFLVALPACQDSNNSTALTLRPETAVVDLGLVPVDGVSTRIPLKNNSETTLRITRTRSSCGCVVVDAPDAIPARSEVFLEVELRGQQQPAHMSSTVAVEMQPAGRKLVRFRYATGRVPVFHPEEVSLVKRADGTYVGTACLWVYVSADDSAVFIEPRDTGESGIELSVQPQQDVVGEGTQPVRIRKRGLHVVRFTVAFYRERVPRLESVAVNVRDGGHSQSVAFRVIGTETQLIEVRPAESTIAFRKADELVGKRRVFILTCASTAECNVLEAPGFLSTSLTQMDDVTWKLDVSVEGPLPVAVDDASVTVQAHDGETTETADAKIYFRTLAES